MEQDTKRQAEFQEFEQKHLALQQEYGFGIVAELTSNKSAIIAQLVVIDTRKLQAEQEAKQAPAKKTKATNTTPKKKPRKSNSK